MNRFGNGIGLGQRIHRSYLGREPQMGLNFLKDILGVDIDTGDIAKSLILAGGGMGALIASPYAPSPANTVLVVGGIGLLGWSVWSLVEAFAGEEAKDENVPVPVNPEAKPLELGCMTGVITEPTEGEWDAIHFSRDFDASFTIKSVCNRDISATVFFDVYEDKKFAQRWIYPKTLNFSKGTGTGSEVSRETDIPLVGSPGFLGIDMTIFLGVRAGGVEKLLDEVSFFVYA